MDRRIIQRKTLVLHDSQNDAQANVTEKPHHAGFYAMSLFHRGENTANITISRTLLKQVLSHEHIRILGRTY